MKEFSTIKNLGIRNRSPKFLQQTAIVSCLKNLYIYANLRRMTVNFVMVVSIILSFTIVKRFISDLWVSSI